MESEQIKKRLPFAEGCAELIVYQKTCDLARRLFRLSGNFPNEERFALTSQLRRASRSIGAQIAEAWAKRRYPKHFVVKLSDADERLETEHWLQTAAQCGYLNEDTKIEGISTCREIGRMLATMMAHPEKFCDRIHACDDTASLRESSD